MKKKVIMLLVAVMACAALLTGCEKTSGDDNEAKASTIEKFKKDGKEVDGITLKWWLVGGHDEYYQYYFKEMKGLQEIQKATGINIEFDVQVNTDNYDPMMIAGNFPDIVTAKHLEMYDGRLDQLFLDGISIDMTPYIDKYMPNFKKILEDYPQISKDLQVATGEYTFASTLYDINNEEDRIATSEYGLAIRKDWLETVGIETVPTNMAEWYEALMAFKTMDPNGDGELTEEPICMASSGWKYFLGAYEIGDDPILNKEGKVFYGYATPQYKEFLTEMNKWNTEGLIYNMFKKATLVDRDDRVTSNFAGSWKADAQHFDTDDPTSYATTLKKSVPGAEIAACPWPKTADGDLYCYSNIASFHRDTTIITKNCKEREAACWLIDAMYSDEGSTLLSWGIEGESYEVVDGEKKMMEGMDETIEFHGASIKKRQTYADPTMIGFPKFKTFASCILATKTEGYVNACKVWSEGDTSYRMPMPAQLNSDQSARVEQATKDMKDYISKKRKEFVEGGEPLTKYDDYLEQVRLMGADEYVKIWQECYDAYIARKAYGE